MNFNIYPFLTPKGPISGNVTISSPAHISLRVSSYHVSIVILRK